jgi:hypothetical protein
VAATERRLGVTLPADYKAFLLNDNGGRVDVPYATPEGEPLPTDETDWRFYAAGAIWRPRLHPDGSPGDGAALEGWLSRFVCVGHNPDQIYGTLLLGVSGPDFGQVRIVDTSGGYQWAYESHRRGRPANAGTFAELLSHLPRSPRSRDEGDGGG